MMRRTSCFLFSVLALALGLRRRPCLGFRLMSVFANTFDSARAREAGDLLLDVRTARVSGRFLSTAVMPLPGCVCGGGGRGRSA